MVTLCTFEFLKREKNSILFIYFVLLKVHVSSLHVSDKCHVSVQCDLCIGGWDGRMLPTRQAISCYSQVTGGSVGGVPCMSATNAMCLCSVTCALENGMGECCQLGKPFPVIPR